MARLDGSPLRARGRDVTQGIAYIAVVSALYSRGDWEVLAEALADAQDGDGRLLQALYDNYVHRAPDGTFDNLFESLIAINCLDDPGPTDLAFPERFAEELARDYPRLGRASGPGYVCNFWPARLAAPLRVTGAGAGPIVVVGTTGDPITPIESTRRLAEELEEGVLVTVEADEHTGYGTNRCIVRAVDQYLLDLTVPEAGLVCR
jgi:pimeloyl-ACP methyl ester carboxylesterase